MGLGYTSIMQSQNRIAIEIIPVQFVLMGAKMSSSVFVKNNASSCQLIDYLIFIMFGLINLADLS